MKLKIKLPTKSSKKSTKTKGTKAVKKRPFDQVLEKSHEVPIVVQFFATWCGPCKTLKPVMEKVAKKANGKWMLAMLDVEQHKAVAMGYGVRSIPVVKLFFKGEEIASFQGVKPEYAVQNWLDNNLPKKKRQTKYSDANNLLKKGDVRGTMTHLLAHLYKDNPDSEMAKLLLALQFVGHNNPQAMQFVNQMERKGDFKELVKSLRDMIDMEVEEQDPHTPSHSPYNPVPNSAMEAINLMNFDHLLLGKLVEQLLNEIRKSQRLPLVKKDRVLLSAATDHNYYQMKNNVLSHHQKNSAKKTVKERIQSFGGKFKTMGENVQYQGLQTVHQERHRVIISETYIEMAQKLVENWVNSPGHYKNMINPKYTFVGTAIGWNQKNHSIFATQVFGGK